MKQIITGPFGRVAYHNAAHDGAGQYPALNMPCCNFARGHTLVAANNGYASNVVPLARAVFNRAAIVGLSLSAHS